MKFSALMLLFLPLLANAGVLYFDGSEADGTDSLAAVKRTEFLFQDGNGKLRLCGFWLLDSGELRKFEQVWDLQGSDVRKDNHSLGSYSAGNFLIEENMGNNQFQAIEVTRTGPTYFEYRFHNPAHGFVDADGWIVSMPSTRLREICKL